jgi:hypothetical protein
LNIQSVLITGFGATVGSKRQRGSPRLVLESQLPPVCDIQCEWGEERRSDGHSYRNVLDQWEAMLESGHHPLDPRTARLISPAEFCTFDFGILCGVHFAAPLLCSLFKSGELSGRL